MTFLSTSEKKTPQYRAAASALLRWYDRHRRQLPWRAAPDQRPDPYAVWLSEIMLQQTTVATVIPYYQYFITRWPTVGALASAGDEEILAAWAGLGYYARARNLIACARVIAAKGGVFPSEEADLITLPGIGSYTAAAIAAIAFERRAIVVDGNVERVMARFAAIETPLPAARSAIRAATEQMTPKKRCGDFAQAMMDLGSGLCAPTKPACILCPLSQGCQARAGGNPASYPRRAARRPKPERFGAVFIAQRADGAVLLRRRPEKGLLGGMTEFPGTQWLEKKPSLYESEAPFSLQWRNCGVIKHVFTHFILHLTVFFASAPVITPHAAECSDGRWTPVADLNAQPFPALMLKAGRLAGLFQNKSGKISAFYP